MQRIQRVCLALAALAALSCGGDDPTGPTTGIIELSLSMWGQHMDPDGCSVSVDDGPTQALREQNPLTVSGLQPGAHTALLSCAAPNCLVAGENPLSLTVAAGHTTYATFEVECAALVGSLEVLLLLSGPEPDPDGCTVAVDGRPPQRLSSGESATFSNLSAGTYELTVADVASNCQVDGGPSRSVAIVADQTTQDTATVSCDWRPYSVYDLGSLCGSTVPCDSTSSTAIGINAAGLVVGRSGPRARFKSTLWDNGLVQGFDIPCLGAPSCYYDQATAINDNGWFIGASCDKYESDCWVFLFDDPTLDPSIVHLWDNYAGRRIFWGTPDLGINDIGQIVGPFFLWENGSVIDLPLRAQGINNGGQVVGFDWLADFAGRRAYVWEDGSMIDLGTLGGVSSYAYDINELGQIVGTAEDSEGRERGFVWVDGMMTDLGTLGGVTSQAYAINELGQVVGMAADTLGRTRAFLWARGFMLDLGTLGGHQSTALGINDLGQVVGWSETTAGVIRATLWSPE